VGIVGLPSHAARVVERQQRRTEGVDMDGDDYVFSFSHNLKSSEGMMLQ
jgi:hypothetical protein